MSRLSAAMCVLLLGCGADASLAWNIEFEDAALAAGTERVRGVIRLGGCDGAQVFTSEASRDIRSADAPNVLSAGTYGFEAIAIDDTCRPVGRGCIEALLPLDSGLVTTTIVSESRPAECPSAECDRGRCAGATDGGTIDLGSMDAGDTDASDGGAVDATTDLGAMCEDVICDSCEQCSDGSCEPLVCPTGVCVDGECCDGCVQDGACQDGNDDSACGAGGTACTVCECGDPCEAGACVPDTTVESVAIAATGSDEVSTCAVAARDGEVFCWGSELDGRVGRSASDGIRTLPNDVGTLDRALEIAAGRDFTLARMSDEVLGWGGNRRGQLGADADVVVDNPETIYGGPAVRVIAGAEMGQHSCIIDARDALLCAGENDMGQIDDRRPGTLDPTLLEGPDGERQWVDVSAGGAHTCGILRGGRLACWGFNSHGQIGNGRSEATIVRTDFVGVASWTQVFAGFQHSCGISDGELYCWGNNSHGQIGNGTVESVNRPTRVLASVPWTSASAGYRHTCGLQGTTLYCWGDNAFGQLGVDTPAGTGLLLPVAPVPGEWQSVDVGGETTCAIDIFGALYCWGENDYGQLGVGDTAHRATPTRVCL